MVVGRTDHLPGRAAPNWVSPKQGSGLMARYAVTVPFPVVLSKCEAPMFITPQLPSTGLSPGILTLG